MTLLNGEPVDSSVPSTGPSASAVGSVGGDAVRPIANPVAQIMGIMGLIFAIAFPPAGLILSIIAKGMSKSAGDRSPFATWGIALGIVFTVLSLLAIIAIIAVSVYGVFLGYTLCEGGSRTDDLFGMPVECN